MSNPPTKHSFTKADVDRIVARAHEISSSYRMACEPSLVVNPTNFRGEAILHLALDQAMHEVHNDGVGRAKKRA